VRHAVLVHQFLSRELPWLPMLGAIAFLVLLNSISWWRLSLDYPVGNTELLLQLVADVGVLTVLLYYGGGSTTLRFTVFAAAGDCRSNLAAPSYLGHGCLDAELLQPADAVVCAAPGAGRPYTAQRRIVQTEQLHTLDGITVPSDYCLTNPEDASASSALPSAATMPSIRTSWGCGWAS